MRSARTVATVMGLALLLLGGCGMSPSPAPSAAPSVTPSGPIGAVLGIYSGRPDPEWMLTTEQSAGLSAILAALVTSTATPPVGGLGYHGFTIRLPASTLVAYQGVVAEPGTGPRAVRMDPTRSVEWFLLESGRASLTSVEIAEVQRALAGP